VRRATPRSAAPTLSRRGLGGLISGLARRTRQTVGTGTAQPGHSHPSPRHERRPSRTARPAIPSATAGSSHQTPNRLLASRPTSTAAARYAHSRFCRLSPDVAAEPSWSPSRSFARPSQGQIASVPIESPTPSQVVSAWCSTIRVRVASNAMYGASRKKLTATSCCARPSDEEESVRDPEKPTPRSRSRGPRLLRLARCRLARSSPRGVQRSWLRRPRSRAT
jgi:hypothetical protein